MAVRLLCSLLQVLTQQYAGLKCLQSYYNEKVVSYCVC